MLQTLLAILQIASFFLSMTLAGYALDRSRFHPVAVVIGIGMISYAIIQADQFLGQSLRGEAAWLARLLWFAYPLPVAMWARLPIVLKSDDNLTLDRVWWTLLLPITMLLILGGWMSDDLVNFATHEPQNLYWTYAVYNVVVALAAAWLLHLNYRAASFDDSLRPVLGFLRLASFAYAGAMLILLSGVLAPAWVFVLVLSDMLIMGMVGIAYDAIAEGQIIRHDFGFTLIKVALTAAGLILPWAGALIFSDVWSLAFGLALFISMGAVALGITLLETLETLLDRLFFRAEKGRRETRDALRILLLNAARQPSTVRDIAQLDHDEFVRLTRRALSHMSNLPRLAASPLTQMKIVGVRAGETSNSLQRANELRNLLLECITALRPQDGGTYGVSDNWRFFNALYYPYVAGISPYKRRLLYEPLDEEFALVVRWFQTTVPPRTLYNWQNRGAELIAELLLEQERDLSPSLKPARIAPHSPV